MQVLTRERHRRYEHQDLWDKFWKDKRGRVVVWQTPNAFLIAWAVLTLLSLFLNGAASDILWWVAIVDLAIWSLLEIFKGVNYLRRALGIIVLVLTILSAIKASS